MGILLLKSSACLAILMLFYKIVLEPLNHHHFKRFYLLAALLLSAIIPFITFIKYVEPTLDFGFYDSESMTTPPYFPAELPTITEGQPNTFLPTLLWAIYAIGVIIFSTRFILNLFKISSKIRTHQKVKTHVFINVLIEKLVIPHTFFNYIFLNKSAFENNDIPQEVLLHEQAHAKQKHSLDILFLEILQVIFWFNPLLYFIKKDIKLNHEFLADQQVLKSGFNLKDYQNLLLRFSSNQKELALVNAINYSSIKKRLTIMNTQTTQRTKWLRSLLLLPVLALLLFSFSQTKEVEKSVKPKINVASNANENLIKTPTLTINQNPLSLKLNGKSTSLENLRSDFINLFGKKDVELQINSKGKSLDYSILEKVTKALEGLCKSIELSNGIKINEQTHKVSPNKDYSFNVIEKKKTTQDKQYPMLGMSVFKGDPIYANKKMIRASQVSVTTEKEVLNFKFKVPGKPTVKVEGDMLNEEAIKNLESANNDSYITYFDIKLEDGSKVPSMIVIIKNQPSKNNKKTIPLPPPPVAHNATKEQKEKYKKEREEYYKKYKIIDGKPTKIPTPSKSKNLKEVPKPPAPPKPKSPLDTVVEMAKKGATFYYNNEKITSDKAIKLLKENKNLNISSSTINNVSTVHINDNDIKTTNKTVVSNVSYSDKKYNEDKTHTSNLTVNAENLEELTKFDWDALKTIFKNNSPEDVIELSFNYNKKVMFNENVIDNVNFTIKGKTNELESMIKKSKNMISKLKEIH
ncbi:M56 family metallopeptidase [Mesoflavibacter zeaxanthinifaciens]|uniref:M56 family metallopeptidase n=1 Tax=Mesoflavibacter zeaxanthinifaciens TaxID=393060 RepID=UPI000412128D|nr:M56 family metallopeptidase [Mesoflavibacter zeaxanthinifaciens]